MPRQTTKTANTNTTTTRKKTSQKPRSTRANNSQTAAAHKIPLHENPIAVYAIQFIMGLVAVYMLVSFVVHSVDSVGGVGVFIRNIFYGLFGSAAFLMPFFLGSVAVFLRRDLESGFLKYRVIFSVSCLVLYASILHLASRESAEVGFAARAMFENGTTLTGGGVLGGFLSEILRRSIGAVGAWIFLLPLSLIFSIFLFGRTPLDLIRAIMRLVREYRDTQADKPLPKPRAVKPPAAKRIKIDNRVNPANSINSINIKADDFDFEMHDNFANTNNAKIETVIEDFSSEIDIEGDEGDASPKGRKRLIDIEPVMLPNKNTFEIGDKNEISENKSENKNDALTNLQEIYEIDESEDADGESVAVKADIFDVPPVNPINSAELQVLDFAPQTREDEPEIAFETSQLFEVDGLERKVYKIPPISYLTKDTSTANVDYSDELRSTAKKLIDTLASFNVKTNIGGYSRGPTITRYEITPDSGTKVRSITNLVDDISLNLATGGVRIEAPIPGKAAVGIEVPNKTVTTVLLRSLLEETQFTNAASKITVALGVDVAGNPIYSDIAKMPHLLIAGATGMGKSVCINSVITSILYKADPHEVKLMLIDPKKVELSIYDGIPHLLVPVVSDPKKAAGSLAWAVNEMENRYLLIQEKNVRNLQSYNEVIVSDPLSEPLPQIVIIIDELADLMMTAPADVEQSICRLAQKARAAGIHLIIGTQRPSVDVITGLIKANIPSRIAFTVASQIDSRTIIDSAGAEKLIGRGDMLYLPNGGLKPMRVQGAYVDERDVLNVVEFWKKQSDGEYDESILSEIDQEAARCNTKGAKMQSKDDNFSADDELKKDSALKPAIELAIDMGRISTSLLQTKLSLGFNRAARIIDTMEKMNVIGPFEGSKPRKVLITREEFIEMTLNNDL